ncbi:acyl-CoA dehydrogenase family protein [Methylobacterium sp. J-068]|uniref:acyl-CoA dehydrogenase family protein n=1 Tax=Methylobacterium sp. J-068 TaxID=2836649 RepID=UPI001FB92CA1|nr:acyl-CoA dehydrogenase family protein [Methylobacterium sp. J-068]MCJ2033194.1 acyl-CoA/acyl-ACP dehydrogenase [Methylobacterium sp. J-068]
MNFILHDPRLHDHLSGDHLPQDHLSEDCVEQARIQAIPARIGAAARAVSRLAAERAEALDRDGGFPAEDVAHAHAAGLLTAPLPVALGGAGLGAPAMAPVLAGLLAQIGRGSLALGRLYEGHVNALALVLRYAEPAVAERLARDVRAGHLFGVWNTQPQTGGLVLENAGAPDAAEGAWTLGGVKSFASGAGSVTRPLVTARRPDGRQQMLVASLEPGTRADLSSWRAQGMRASTSGILDFSGLRVGAGDFVGGPDDYFREPHFSGGAWRFAAVQLGGIEAVFDALRDHLRESGRGGDPHQAARLGEAAIAVETARLFVDRAARLAGDPEAEPARVIAYVNLTRLAVERAGLDVLERAQRSVGLAGFLSPHPLERLARDLATYLRQPGPDRALTSAAAHVLAETCSADELWRDPPAAVRPAVPAGSSDEAP